MPFSTPGKKPSAPSPRRCAPRTRRRHRGWARARATRHRTCRDRRSASCTGRGPWSCPLIVSLYGTLGMCVWIAAPNLRFSRSRITAVCASPIVRSVCSPTSVRSRSDGRILLEQPGEGGPILSRSCFEMGSIATTNDGGGNSSGSSLSGFSLTDERVAGLGDGQFGDRPDLASLELADRLLLLAVEQQQLADALVLVTGAVPDVGLRGSVPDSTRRQVRRPTNGSAVVLKTGPGVVRPRRPGPRRSRRPCPVP